MILEAVVLPVVGGQETAFEAAFAEAAPIVASMPGYLGHELHRGIEEPRHYLLLVRWARLEDHTAGFRGSPEYQRWSALLHRFYDPVPEVSHYTPIAGLDGPSQA